MGKTFSGLMIVVAAAVSGLALMYLPGWLVEKYQVVQQLSPWAGWAYIFVVAVGCLLFLGSLLAIVYRLWGATLLKRRQRERRSRNPSELTLSQQRAEIDENLEQLRDLRAGHRDNPAVNAELGPLLQDVVEKRETLTLEIVVFGTISSGKSSVLNLLAGRDIFSTDVRGGTTVTRNEVPWDKQDRVILVDTPGLGEVDGERHVGIAAESAKDADLVLLVVDGPLRDSEFRLLQKLGEMEKRVLVCLNKVDWYEHEDRQKLLNQLRQQTQAWVRNEEVVAIQATPGERLRRRVLVTGEIQDETIIVPPDLGALAERMMHVVERDRKELVMSNLLLQSRGLLEKARERVKQAVDTRAWELVDRYMWGAAGVAAVSPVMLVDLIAGVGISTKMIMDLGDIYGQKMDLPTARRWLAEMGKTLISVMGYQGVSVVTASVVASLIKTVPIAGHLAGNAVQGAIQALLTRWIGGVFIEYFGNEMQFVDGGLANVARRHWNQLTAPEELRKLVVQARQKFSN